MKTSSNRRSDSFPGLRYAGLQRAAGKLTTLVFGTLLFVSLYCAYHILPFYYYFYELQNQFEAHAKVADEYTIPQLRQKLMYHINHMQIPIERPEDLRIEKSSSGVVISLPYSEVFYITFQGKEYIIKRFDFVAHAERNFKGG